MHDVVNKLVHSVLQKNNLDECTTDELKKITSRYPYFSSAQLLLSVKLMEENNPAYEEQMQKTRLYFNNPLWLQQILTKKSKITDSDVLPKVQEIISPVFEDFQNDELVIENPRHVFTSKEQTETKQPAKPFLEIKTGITSSFDAPLVFEPYHTVDYFASQGIKQKAEEHPKDRFSQQLKSFTEWLKTIRQIPPQQLAAQTDTGSEAKVMELATHSIEDRNVITEAMAEVWIKQNQPEKAIEIYRKLSLLNPSKSSYFASLIEKLIKTT